MSKKIYKISRISVMIFLFMMIGLSGINYSIVGADAAQCYYVSPDGNDTNGNGTEQQPWKTLAYAASQVPENQGNTIILAPGEYYETEPTVLGLKTNILGAGEDVTIIKSSGVTVDPSVDTSSASYNLWYDGSLIQLASQNYSTAGAKYGSPDEMVPAKDGNQTISGFTIDGQNKSLKCGIWVENRNNVTVNNITFKDLKQTGAVFSRGDMWWYEPLPEGMWMYNTKIYNCTFLNSGSLQGGEQEGNLCLGGLDGAEIYNIRIIDDVGSGIKFKHVGHFRNVKIHDCYTRLNEYHSTWGEIMAIELWNLSYGNEIYNIDCNTWFSLVNHAQLTDDYAPTEQHPSNLVMHDVTMVDTDGRAGTEAVEVALSGVEIYDSYFQDKPYYIAIWGGAGWGGVANHAINIHNNIFANVNRQPTYGFGDSAAIFNPDGSIYDISINNNVFDRMGNALSLGGTIGAQVKNNIFLMTDGEDLLGGSNISFNNNIKHHTDDSKQNFKISCTLGTGNRKGDPGLKYTGDRNGDYYKSDSAASLCVDTGTEVGLPFNGNAPDVGRWESLYSNETPAPPVDPDAPDGGNAQLPEYVYEVEDGTLSGNAVVKSDYNGYSGSGYLEGFAYSNSAQVSITVDVPVAGEYDLKIRYSAGNGDSENTGLYINDNKVKNLSCPATNNWSTWRTITETVNLVKGTNVIKLSNEFYMPNGINPDSVTVIGPTSIVEEYPFSVRVAECIVRDNSVVGIRADVVNNTESLQDAVVYFAVIDGDHMTTDVFARSYTFGSLEEKPFDITDIKCSVNGYVKIFVWEKDTLAPMSVPKVIDKQMEIKEIEGL